MKTRFDAYRPPMSLGESQRLLDAESRRIQGKEDARSANGLLFGFFMMLVFIGCVIGTLVFWLNILLKLFR